MLKVIKSESDYDAALARVDELMDAEADTLEAEELGVLAILIKKYEDDRFPIDAPTPLEAIRFRMEQQNLAPRDLEPILGSRSRVSEVLSGSRTLSIDMIRALNKHLGIPATSLIGTELVESNTPQPEPSAAVLYTLKRWKFLKANEKYDSFLARVWPADSRYALLRKTLTDRTNAKTDHAALYAWCASALFRSQSCKPTYAYSKHTMNDDWIRSLSALSLHDDGPKRAVSALKEVGIALVVQPHFAGTYLDGAAMCRSDDVPVVALSIRHDRTDNFWFTLLHELAHVERHLSPTMPAICDDLDIKSSTNQELEADQIAEAACIPDDMWADAGLTAYASTAEIMRLADRASVNPAIVAGRWQRQFGDYRKFSKLLGRNTIKQQFDVFSE
jgi:HTH-type transcriptional regulator / antitoxin HigA